MISTEETVTITKVIVETQDQPLLGLATTAQLIDELRARIELNGTLDYKTIDY